MKRGLGISTLVCVLFWVAGLAFAQNDDFFVVIAGGRDWKLTGNAGTNPGTHFVGTTDNQTLDFRVNNSRALRLEPPAYGISPNVIGGHSDNSVSAGVYGATISGGGQSGFGHIVSNNYATVGGGYFNTASGYAATVGGGESNTAGGQIGATVGGGLENTASGIDATVGGGSHNTANSDFATVGGGFSNTASGWNATVGGGYENTASGLNATVPGGVGAVASHYGEMAYANGRFANDGDAQTSLYVLRNQTTDGTPTELFLNGVSERLTIASNRVMTFDILVVAKEIGFGINSAGYQIRGVIENIGGTTTGSYLRTDLREDISAWNAYINPNNTHDALCIMVIGSAGMTIRWVASVRTVEVGG